MTKIEAIIQPFKLDDAKEALTGIDGMTIQKLLAGVVGFRVRHPTKDRQSKVLIHVIERLQALEYDS